MALRVGVDLDGVVADFRAAFRNAAADAGVSVPSAASGLAAESIAPREIKKIWDHIRRTPNWWTQLKPYERDQLPRLHEFARERRWEVIFMTRRPATAGDSVQFQSQWWLERQGFYHPAVVTVPGSRGELANALRLDAIVDDQLHNCVDVIGASMAKAILVQRDAIDAAALDNATNRGIGVVYTLQEAIDVLTHLHETMKERKGRLQRLTDWFGRRSGSTAGTRDLPDPDRGRSRSDPGDRK